MLSVTLLLRGAYIYAMGELTFLELRSKEIVNSCDGRRLGRIIDLVFTEAGKVKGIVAPFNRRGLFAKAQDVYIPYSCIKKIGEDVIIVEIQPECTGSRPSPPPHGGGCPPPHGDCPPRGDDCSHGDSPPHDGDREHRPSPGDCDMRCEKCMLFDCAYRWRDRGRK